jgi:hypothetical protein
VTKKTVVLVLVGVAVLLALCAGGLFFVGKKVTSFVAEPQWTQDAVPQRDVHGVFGVRLPAGVSVYRSRSSGFQDPLLEALVELPPGGAAGFLESNRLTLTAEVPEPDAEAQIRKLRPEAQVITSAGLEGLVDLTSDDGGFVELYRHAFLFTVDGVSWVYLVAVGM